jgi:digeranylgeranylglycerophospholipid reductase
MYDAAIIGGGPVGSRAAFRLADMGFSVVVLEKKANPGDSVCCTGIIGQECVNRFAFDNKVIYREVNSASIYSPSGKLLHIQRQEPQASIVDRPALNVYLAGLAENKGAVYLTGNTVTNIEVNSDRVLVSYENNSGKKNSLEARVVIIASGFRSRLVEQAGLGRAGDYAMGVQAEVETNGLNEVEVYLGDKTAPGFFAWLVPTRSGQALAGLITHRRSGYYMKKLLASLVEQGKIIDENPEIFYAGIALKALSRTSTDRVIVVGSAAGQVKPITGGGVYYGLLCADIAVDSLQHALENDNLTAGSLANYDKQWKRVLGRELKLGNWSRKFYEHLNDKRVDRIFDIIVSNKLDKAILDSEDIRFDWHSAVILKLMGNRVLTDTFKTLKRNFTLGNKQ